MRACARAGDQASNELKSALHEEHLLSQQISAATVCRKHLERVGASGMSGVLPSVGKASYMMSRGA